MPKIRIGISFVAVVATAFCFDTGNLLIPCLLCAIVHELGHLAVIKICGGKVREIRISALGAYIKLESVPMLSYKNELLSAAAGPAVSIALSFFLSFLGNFTGEQALYIHSGTSMLLGLVNLIPVFPLDGGRVIKCATMLVLDTQSAECVCNIIGAVFVFLAANLCVYININVGMQLSLVLFSAFLAVAFIKGIFCGEN